MSLPGDGAEVVIAPKRQAEEGRGGFVLRAKSDEVPHRRRSLVERTGMKNFVQVCSSTCFKASLIVEILLT